MVEPARQFTATNSTGYRFGFNGKEKSDEINGSGVDYDYGARIYDARIGRFLSVDALTPKYPELTPYQFASNTPIQAIDLDGLEKYIVAKQLYSNGDTKSITVLYTVNKDDTKSVVDMKFKQLLGKNPDGTFIVSDKYLTEQGQDVIRITTDADGNQTFGKGRKLNTEEQAIVDNHSTNDLSVPNANYWEITVGKKIYNSETPRNDAKMTDKTAYKKFSPPTITNPEASQLWTLRPSGNNATNAANFALAQINQIVKNFTDNNKNVTNVITEVTITTLPSNKNFASVLLNKLTAIGIKATIVTSVTYTRAAGQLPPPNVLNTPQDYDYNVKTTGTLKK